MNESKLISEKKLATWQIQEIKRTFEMANMCKTGELTINDIRFMLEKLLKGNKIEYEDLKVIFSKITPPSKTTISWDDFLGGISYISYSNV